MSQVLTLQASVFVLFAQVCRFGYVINVDLVYSNSLRIDVLKKSAKEKCLQNGNYYFYETGRDVGPGEHFLFLSLREGCTRWVFL